MRTQRGAGRLVLLIVVAALIVAVALTSRQRRLAEGGDGTLGQSPKPDSQITAAAQRSLVDYWTDKEPKIYHRQFTKLAGGFQPKTPQSPPFTCGGQSPTYAATRSTAVVARTTSPGMPPSCSPS